MQTEPWVGLEDLGLGRGDNRKMVSKKCTHNNLLADDTQCRLWGRSARLKSTASLPPSLTRRWDNVRLERPKPLLESD